MKGFALRLSTQASEEYEEAFTYYQAQSPGLGSRFSLDLLQVLERIEQNPRQFQVESGRFRRAHLRVFPYTVFFEIIEVRAEIEVLAIWHQAARPGGWQR